MADGARGVGTADAAGGTSAATSAIFRALADGRAVGAAETVAVGEVGAGAVGAVAAAACDVSTTGTVCGWFMNSTPPPTTSATKKATPPIIAATERP